MALNGAITSTAADLIDNVLATGNKSGYSFTWAGGGTSGAYTINADPVGSGGQIHYFTDQSLVIRSNANHAAAATDPAIGN